MSTNRKTPGQIYEHEYDSEEQLGYTHEECSEVAASSVIRNFCQRVRERADKFNENASHSETFSLWVAFNELANEHESK